MGFCGCCVLLVERVEMVERRNTCAEKGGFGCVGRAKKVVFVLRLCVCLPW